MVMVMSVSRKRITVIASVKGLERAERVLVRLGFASKEKFAQNMAMGKSTIDSFFTRKPIQLDKFQEICKALEIDWKETLGDLEEVLEQTEHLKSEHQTVIAQEPTVQGHFSGSILVATDRDSGEIEGELILKGDFKTFSEKERIIIELWLKTHGGSTIRITDVQVGSIKIKIQGSQKDIAKLFDYLNSGDVSAIESFSIQDTNILSSEFLADLEAVETFEEPLDVQKISSQESLEVKIRRGDFRGANLSGADFRGANLSRADLSGANLSGAILSRANLSRADLSGANLSGAILSRANLSGADLSGADLSWADLSWADLSWAKLIRTDLTGVDMSNVENLNGAVFGQNSGLTESDKADMRQRGAF
jgi:DNA-binding Xre family transcriptional regulator